MSRLLITIVFLLAAGPGFSQSFLDSYRVYCTGKINSSLREKAIVSDKFHGIAAEKMNRSRVGLQERLNDQIKKLSAIFRDRLKSTGLDLNRADSLTIIYRTTDKSGLANFIIISGKDTLRSTQRLALVREINNGGGRLAPVSKDAASFSVYKTSNANIAEPFVALALAADTAYAYAGAVYCPVERGINPIIITAKKNNKGYIIGDYYVHGFSFVSLRATR